MFRWRDLAVDDGLEVKKWAKKKLKDDEMVAVFAKAFTTYSWSQGMGMFGLGDAVAKRNTNASVDSLDKLLDRDLLRKRVEEVAANGGTDDAAKAVSDFLTAWKKKDAGDDD